MQLYRRAASASHDSTGLREVGGDRTTARKGLPCFGRVR